MKEKSLLYNLFMKYLGEDGEEEEAKQETPLSDHGGDDKQEHMQDGGEAIPQETDGELSEQPDIPRKTEPEPLIETVEDWNEAELQKQRELDARSRGAEEPDSDEMPAEPEEEIVPSRDSSLELAITDDKMKATMMVWEPEGDGADITEEALYKALQEKHITYGIDEEKIRDIAENKRYRQLFVIASGKPAKDGTSGKIKDFFPRQVQLKYATKQNGGIDFKNMNLIHNVKEGDVVCQITRPTDPEDGMSIYGQPVRGRQGAMPAIPQGKNITYNEDGTQLVAACEGNLTFRSGRFHVEKVFEVAGNVDNSIGNINFSGSVFIQGDVFEGYEVRAKGNITVMGMVEGAALIAGGDIQLQKGMRGMHCGVLEAGGDITAKFLEDCTIHAGSNIQAEYIINSQVACENNLTLVGRRGAFIGGSCSVYNEMNVKAVGAASHITTSVTLGATPQLIAEAEKAAREIREVSEQMEENRKNTAWLTEKQNRGSLTPVQQQRLSALNLEASVNKLKQRQLQSKAAQLAKQIREVGRTRLQADEVYPGTIICIGDSRLVVMDKEDSVSYYYLDGEIRKGMR